MTTTKWNTITTPKAWTQKARELLAQARDAVKSNNEDSLTSASDDLLEFLQERTTDCPDDVAASVFHAQAELVRIVAGQITGSIASRTTQITAYLQDVQRAAAKLDQDADLISLKTIKDAVDTGQKLVGTLQEVGAQLKGDSANINPAKVAGQVQQVAAGLQALFEKLSALKAPQT